MVAVWLKKKKKKSKIEQEISEEIDGREDFKMIADKHKVVLHQLIVNMQDNG